MKNQKEYFYQERVIRLQYHPSNRFHDGGWHWECFENGERICDSLKQYPSATIGKALEDAKDEIDWLFDIDSEKFPVAVEV